MGSHKTDLAALIQIRQFLMVANEDMSIQLGKEDFKAVQAKIRELNKEIIRLSLELDLTSKQVVSTVPMDTVMAAIRNQDSSPKNVQQVALEDDLVDWQKDVGEIVDENDGDDVEQEGVVEASKAKSRGKIKRST